MGLPTGTVTFWMSDIEGSTRLLRRLGGQYPSVLATHHRLVRDAVTAAGGTEVSTEGDAFFCVFTTAADAVDAAVHVQRALAGWQWPDGERVAVRIGVHTGDGVLGSTGYTGLDVHRAARVCAAGHGGQVLLSQATWDLVADRLPDGVSGRALGPHQLKDLPASEALHQLVVAGLPSQFPPLRAVGRPGSGLPEPAGPLVGRDRELAEVAGLLREARLVTLTGPGGAGKTRLAVEVARSLTPECPDGVHLVPLAAVSDPLLVAPEVERALGLPPAHGGWAGLPRVLDHLRDRRLLLVLDNLEQLLDAVPVVVQLLDAAAGLRVLVTSRSPLRVAAEREYPLGPLPVPPSADLPAAELLGYPAVQHLVVRARAARPGLRLGDADTAALARVAIAVDGLPLAAELAAARLRVLDPAELADRLEPRLAGAATDGDGAGAGKGLSLLGGTGLRDLPDRQRTLRAAVGWSHDLLAEPARRLFEVLGAFPGGATLDAVEAVAGTGGAGPSTGDGAGEPDTLDLLEQLVDQSLVLREAGDPPRYRMLRVIREFAAERLRDGGHADAVRDRQAQWAVALVERAAPRLLAGDRAGWLDRLAAEQANLRAVLDDLLQRDRDLAGRIAAGLWRYWQVRGLLVEATSVLQRVLSDPPPGVRPTSAAVRAEALTALGGISYWRRDSDGSHAAYTEALGLFEQVQDASGVARSRYNQAFPRYLRDDPAGARALAAEALDRFAALGDRDGVARARWLLGITDQIAGDLDSAATRLAQAVEELRPLDDAFHLGWALRVLARVELRQGRPADARRHLAESLPLFAAVCDTPALVLHLSDAAFLAVQEGDPERALLLVGATRHLQRVSGTDLVDDRLNAPPSVDELCAVVGERGRALVDEGAALGVQEAVATALAGGPRGTAEPTVAPGTPANRVPEPRGQSARARAPG